jgi:peptidoglycan/LPS O-acetylase OafA/YrhL
MFLHIFYLQTICGIRPIPEITWTLCTEIQLYLGFVLMLILVGWNRQNDRPASLGRLLLLFGPLTVLSMWVQATVVACPHSLVFFKFWYLFQFGVPVCWSLDGIVPRTWVLLFAAVMLTLAFTVRYNIGCVGIGAGLLIFGVRVGNGLQRGLAFGPLQYLGSRSYSIYLTHLTVGGPIANYFTPRIFGPTPTVAAGILMFSVAVTTSVLFAEAFYRLIERPSTLLSRRFSLQPARKPTVVVVEETENEPTPRTHPVEELVPSLPG